MRTVSFSLRTFHRGIAAFSTGSFTRLVPSVFRSRTNISDFPSMPSTFVQKATCSPLGDISG